MARDRASRPEARPLRLFVAVDVPEAERRRLSAAVSAWRGELPSARWVKPENWHVTLKFLGSTWPRLREWVGEQVAETARHAAPFPSRITDVGAFPSSRRARVLWAGLEDDEGIFARLATELDERLEQEFRVEKRSLTPHLTVARFKQQAALPESVLETDVSGEPFTVRELTLYRSILQRPAARYEVLERFPLGAGSDTPPGG